MIRIYMTSTSSMETIPAISAQPMDDTDNHSSEEELEVSTVTHR